MSNKTKNILRWIPSVVIACFVMMSATLKLTGFPPIVKQFTEMGLAHYLKMFGLMEWIFMALFIHPRSAKIGFMLLTAYFGGAMAVELALGSFMIGPAAILVIIWMAAYLRKPGIFNEARGRELSSSGSRISIPVAGSQ